MDKKEIKESLLWLIPGYGIYKLLTYGQDRKKELARQERELAETKEEGNGLRMVVNHYMNLSKQSDEVGDLEKAEEYREQAKAEVAQYVLDHREGLENFFNRTLKDAEMGKLFKETYGASTLEEYLKMRGIDKYINSEEKN